MKKNQSTIVADLSFLILLVLLFISLIFIGTREETFFRNAVFLIITFFIMVLTYFTNITVGLIVNLVLIFLYMTWLLYSVAALKQTFSNEFYFWLVMSPVLTTATSLTFSRTKSLEIENEEMRKQVQNSSTIDYMTGLKNRQAFISDLSVYQSISRRYNLTLLLIVCEYRYPDELKNIFGKEKLADLTKQISKNISQNFFRTEDEVFLLSSDPFQWGIILLSDQQQEQLIMSRIREGLSKIDTGKMFGKHAPSIDIRIGAFYDSEKETPKPLDLLESAQKQMSYDV